MQDACTHCGLLLGRRALRATVGGEAGRFCCVGCVLAMQVTRARGDAGAASSLLVRLGVALFFAMNVMMTSMPTYVPHAYGDAEAPLDGPLFLLLRVLAAIFALPVLAILGGPVLGAAAQALRRGRAGSDVLVLLAVLAAYALSLANTLAGRSEVYFDTAVMLLVLVTAGRYLEAQARAEAGRAIEATLGPRRGTACRLRDGRREEVAAAELRPGDVVEVSPGDAFPTDGVVVDGRAAVDESALTGESRPVVKHPGSAVAGGTCSIDGRLRVRVSAAASESAGARIEALVRAARRERSAAERLADRLAGWLVPLVLLLALAAGAWWTSHAGFDRGV
ncbi:MAG: HAD-IC family P-type ATPase, partial [Thermodesulfobacteriota bacterium]